MPPRNRTALRPRERRAAARETAELPETNAVRALAGAAPLPQPPERVLPDGYVSLIWHQIEPDPLNPRKTFDDESIAELADSIARDGLLENLVVRAGVVPPNDGSARLLDPEGEPLPLHRLVAGERRHRAMGLLIQSYRWGPEAPIVCKVVTIDDAAHRRIALVENLQRKDLKPLEEARALQQLIDDGASTAALAAEIGFTQRWVQQRLQLLELPPALVDQVDAGTLKIEKAREALALLPKLPAIKQIELREGKITVDAAKEWLEDQPEPIVLTTRQWLIALEVFDATIRCGMTKASYEYDRAEVGLAALDDEDLRVLVEKRFFSGPRKHQDKHYIETGRYYVSLQYGAHDLVEGKFGTRGGDKDALLKLLDQARGDAGVEGDFKPKSYATPWLNRPFDIPADVAAKYAAILKKRADDEAKAKVERDRAQERAEARQANAAANALVVDQLVRDLAASPPRAPDARFAETLSTAGLPAPWKVCPNGGITCANGYTYSHPSWSLESEPWILHQRVLLALAVNLAAGVTFNVEPDAPAAVGDEAKGDAPLEGEDA